MGSVVRAIHASKRITVRIWTKAETQIKLIREWITHRFGFSALIRNHSRRELNTQSNVGVILNLQENFQTVETHSGRGKLSGWIAITVEALAGINNQRSGDKIALRTI